MWRPTLKQMRPAFRYRDPLWKIKRTRCQHPWHPEKKLPSAAASIHPFHSLPFLSFHLSSTPRSLDRHFTSPLPTLPLSFLLVQFSSLLRAINTLTTDYLQTSKKGAGLSLPRQPSFPPLPPLPFKALSTPLDPSFHPSPSVHPSTPP